ncbi:lipocalin-like domain-containing protein [Frateuria hangzhouensis]|uniref:lipocalin-like domain-containing protein n=1 Tax=Frateuria hangzhouensis TaxID=2995589 RepID=UPI0022608BDC|nr:lipocalin-like domain-containing protein [Frateuria sp. STR12]MCX7514757.1 lipocalin-like domain-containing protein [Frateuria sp. STR12]
MSLHRTLSRLAATAVLLPTLAWTTGASATDARGDVPLAGTWTLVAADVLHPDGSRAHDYGDAPKGLLLIDHVGHYSLQLYRSDRARFAHPAKAKASAQEYRAAVMGSSTHYGTLAVEADRHELVFHIESASFPNWEGQEQRRSFELKGDTLSYRVPPRPDGNVPISVWRRIGD